MSQTVRAFSPASGVHVFTARSSSGAYWNGSAFEAYNASNIATYAITATSEGGGWYSASISDSAVSYDLRLRVGGSLATTDAVIDAYPTIPITSSGGVVQADIAKVLGSAGAASGIYQIGDKQITHTDGDQSYDSLLNLGDYYLANGTVPTAGGSSGGTSITILSNATYAGATPNRVGDPYNIYRGRKASLNFALDDYTGDVTDGQTLTLRVIPVDDYNDQASDDPAALAEATATVSVSGTTLSVTFQLTNTQTAALPAGARGDGASYYRLHVYPPSNEYTLFDRPALVWRSMATPA